MFLGGNWSIGILIEFSNVKEMKILNALFGEFLHRRDRKIKNNPNQPFASWGKLKKIEIKTNLIECRCPMQRYFLLVAGIPEPHKHGSKSYSYSVLTAWLLADLPVVGSSISRVLSCGSRFRCIGKGNS